MIEFAIVIAGAFVFLGFSFLASAIARLTDIIKYVTQDEWHLTLHEARIPWEEGKQWRVSYSAMAWHEPMGIEGKEPGSTYYERYNR